MVISEVAKEIELTADTLRYYEKEGLIGPIAKEKKWYKKLYRRGFAKN